MAIAGKTAWASLLAVLVTACLSPVADCAYAFNDTGPLSTYKSRPDILAPFLNVTLHNDSAITPGYIFLEPYQTTQPGPYLYDNTGNLVWSGFQTTGPGPAHDFHVCHYQGADHLCFFTGQQYVGYARGVGLILDDRLNVVQSVQSQGGLSPIDQHEFNVVGNGSSALLTIYQTRRYDLSGEGISGGIGWITDSWFQEVETGTNKLLFQWSSLNHVDPSYTYIAPSSTESSGTGLTSDEPWDYFHINSVDKDSNGDYLVSARHTSTLYKISSINGSIIWQLGGKSSDFTLAGGLNFSYQHDARVQFQNSTTTILSLFDNAADGYHKQSSAYSSGMIIKVDHTINAATLLQRFIAPNHMISSSQGSVQVFNNDWQNGNVYCSWGENAYLSEYASDGTMVLQAHFATTGSMHYRSRKANFTMHPTDTPTAYVYALNSKSPTVFYMSWNGATEVTHWRIHASTNSDSSTGFQVLATVPKEGFETTYTASSYYLWSIIEALDVNGNSLANSSRTFETFVPGTVLAAHCDTLQCPVATGYSSKPTVISSSLPEGSPTITGLPRSSATSSATSSSSSSPPPGHSAAPKVQLGLLVWTMWAWTCILLLTAITVA